MGLQQRRLETGVQAGSKIKGLRDLASTAILNIYVINEGAASHQPRKNLVERLPRGLHDVSRESAVLPNTEAS